MEGKKGLRKKQRQKYVKSLKCISEETSPEIIKPAGSIDISESGIGIITDYELTPGRVIMLKILEKPYTLRLAVVKWCREIDKNKYRSGLMFI